MQRFLFPRWTNKFLALLGVLGAAGGAYAGALFLGVTSPVTLNTGYRPEQPVPFSHALHSGELKMDCRYCHNSVDKSAHSSVPATQTCINCHSPKTSAGAPTLSAVHSDSLKLKPVHESWRTGESVHWVRIHRLPDFVYFNHSAHVNRGVSCVTCHGRVDQMSIVHQDKDQSMAWCIDCHRNPEPHLRPLDQITNLAWHAGDDDDSDAEIKAKQLELGKKLKKDNNINPQANCAVCHR
ncbi:MAG: cytochrome c family protein [Pirellula sp.]|nr:cytochrome c family protein [Pirellula sp.]